MSDLAPERAGMIAESLHAQLVLVHAVPQAEPHHLLEEDLQRAGRQLRRRATPPQWRHGVAPTFEIRTGSPVQALVEAARGLEPALIVLGSNRRHFACDALAGTVAERVLKQVDCPVLVVRHMPRHAYRRVLLLLDCAGSSEVIAAAGRLVLHGRANAAVTQAYDCFCASLAGAAADSSPADIEHPLIIAEPRGRSSAELTAEALQVAMMHERATMVNLIHRHDGHLCLDLLVVGAGRRRWVRRMFLRDAMNRLLAAHGSDVLIVPRCRECRPPQRNPSGGAARWRALLCTPQRGVRSQRPSARVVAKPTRWVDEAIR